MSPLLMALFGGGGMSPMQQMGAGGMRGPVSGNWRGGDLPMGGFMPAPRESLGRPGFGPAPQPQQPQQPQVPQFPGFPYGMGQGMGGFGGMGQTQVPPAPSTSQYGIGPQSRMFGQAPGMKNRYGAGAFTGGGPRVGGGFHSRNY